MKRRLAILAGIVLAACVPTLALAYDPAGCEEFVFAEKAESLGLSSSASATWSS
jgi:hypothetical protein